MRKLYCQGCIDNVPNQLGHACCYPDDFEQKYIEVIDNEEIKSEDESDEVYEEEKEQRSNQERENDEEKTLDENEHNLADLYDTNSITSLDLEFVQEDDFQDHVQNEITKNWCAGCHFGVHQTRNHTCHLRFSTFI
jgi:hypothetical protein